jgi:sodium transport system permease protein
MNWQNIVTVYCKELKDSLRDRRTIISMIVIPTILMPLLMFGVGSVMTKIVKQARDEASALVILGGADSPGVVAALKADKRFRVVESPGDFKQLISDKKIRLAVEIPAGFEASLKTASNQAVTIYHYEGELKRADGGEAPGRPRPEQRRREALRGAPAKRGPAREGGWQRHRRHHPLHHHHPVLHRRDVPRD